MKFCSLCGGDLHRAVPPGDDRLRHVCLICGEVHYQNPKMIAGCIPVLGDRVLLCRRAIEPRYGTWTLPAGFMELGESLSEAAGREALEEANVEVVMEELFTLFSLPHISQVYAFFLAKMVDETFSPGTESLEVKLFLEEDIPWDELSFETVRRSLKLFFEDRRAGRFQFRVAEIGPDARKF